VVVYGKVLFGKLMVYSLPATGAGCLKVMPLALVRRMMPP